MKKIILAALAVVMTSSFALGFEKKKELSPAEKEMIAIQKRDAVYVSVENTIYLAQRDKRDAEFDLGTEALIIWSGSYTTAKLAIAKYNTGRFDTRVALPRLSAAADSYTYAIRRPDTVRGYLLEEANKGFQKGGALLFPAALSITIWQVIEAASDVYRIKIDHKDLAIAAAAIKVRRAELANYMARAQAGQ